MKRILLAAAFAASLTAPAAAQETGIEAVISSQIEAFRADDFETAFTFASPMIKGIFGNPQRFGSMVQQGYPMVWRPADVEFLGQRVENGAPVQTVMITDGDGAIHILEYKMIQSEAGWQIDGVSLVQPPAPSA